MERANAAALEDRGGKSIDVLDGTASTTTGANDLSDLGDGTEFADAQAMLVVLSTREHACLLKLRMWQRMVDLSSDRVDHFRFARMDTHAKTREQIESMGSTTKRHERASNSSSRIEAVAEDGNVVHGSAVTLAEDDPDYFVFDSEGYPEHHSTAETRDIIDVATLSAAIPF